jgi:hypothetical protein
MHNQGQKLNFIFLKGGFFLDRCNPYSVFFVVIAMMAISVGAMVSQL